MEIPKAHATDSIAPPGEHVAKTRILVVDEHPLLRHGIVAFINGQPDMIACGEADCISSIRAKLAETKPHLLVIGLRLGTGDSLEFVKALKAEYPSLLILVYSAFEEAIFAERAVRAGANGYVMKHEAMANVVQAINEVFSSRPYLSPAMAAQIITKFAHGTTTGEADATDRLSDRELEILEAIGKGKDVHQIAKLLHLSPKTVETHRAHIKEKLQLKNAREVARFAVQWVDAREV